MKFRNPWIDPRIVQVRPEAVQAYLLSKGWQYLGRAEAAPYMLMFDTPQPREDKPNVLLPLKWDYGSDLQRLIDLVSEVALHEDRWAVDVLADMLRQPVESVPANRAGLPVSAESAPQ
jgi:hypothetical protein